MADTSPSPYGAPTTSGNSILSDIGNIGQGLLSSPTVGAAVTGYLGYNAAGKASQQTQQLVQPIQQTGQQFIQAGQQTLGQTQPALTQSIPGQTAFATEQQGVAATYGTGQLTATQQQQINTYIQQQKSMVMAELANAGINDPNSSQAQTKFQQIQNNAAGMAQNMVAGNQQIATGAQTAVQNTYSTLLNQALATAGYGTGATMQAAQQIIQSDAQTSAALQNIWKQISNALTTASGSGGSGGGAAGPSGISQAWGGVKDLLSKAGINIGGTSQPGQTTGPTDYTGPGSLTGGTTTPGTINPSGFASDPFATPASSSGGLNTDLFANQPATTYTPTTDFSSGDGSGAYDFSQMGGV